MCPSQAETVSKKDAMQFPLVGSAVLFGLYVVIKFVKKEYLDMLLAFYFSVLGSFSIYACIAPPLTASCGFDGRKKFEFSFHWKVWKSRDAEDASPVEFSFSWFDIVLYLPCAGASAAYALTKKWWLNNLLGCAFSVQAIEMLSLGSYAIVRATRRARRPSPPTVVFLPSLRRCVRARWPSAFARAAVLTQSPCAPTCVHARVAYCSAASSSMTSSGSLARR
jgi:hypothetical protein